MDLTDILRSQGGIDAIANQLGISPADAERGVGALLPSILEGMGQQAASASAGSGAGGGLADILTRLGGGALATNVVAPEPTEVDKGNTILGEIFGSKDVSRQVAGHAAQSTGIDPAILKKMLPILAMLAGGYLSSRSSQGGGGGLGGILGSVLGSIAGNQPGGGLGGGLGSILGSVLGGRR